MDKKKRLADQKNYHHNSREELFSSSGKLKIQSVSGRQKAADYVKILNDLSLTQEGCHLCEEEWIFQQDNAATHMHHNKVVFA